MEFPAEEASIVGPTPREKHQLFEEFNSGKNSEFIIKEEYEKFQEKIGQGIAGLQVGLVKIKGLTEIVSP